MNPWPLLIIIFCLSMLAIIASAAWRIINRW